jgi:hypothetical protein
MDEQNLTLVPMEQLPQTDEAKPKRLSINILQENLIKLMERDKRSLADVQKATGIAWGSLYGYYVADVTSQLLDINIKELSDYFDVSIDFLAFGIKKYKFDTFDRQELYRLKDGEAS